MKAKELNEKMKDWTEIDFNRELEKGNVTYGMVKEWRKMHPVPTLMYVVSYRMGKGKILRHKRFKHKKTDPFSLLRFVHQKILPQKAVFASLSEITESSNKS